MQQWITTIEAQGHTTYADDYAAARWYELGASLPTRRAIAVRASLRRFPADGANGRVAGLMVRRGWR